MAGDVGLVEIRPVAPADVPLVRRLSADAFSRYGDYERIVMEFGSLQSVATRVAAVDGGFSGFMMVEVPGGRPDVGDILAIAVEPSARRRGVGRALIAEAEALTRRALGRGASLVLTVALDNAPARALFKKCGFVEVPRSHGVYPSGLISTVMQKGLGT